MPSSVRQPRAERARSRATSRQDAEDTLAAARSPEDWLLVDPYSRVVSSAVRGGRVVEPSQVQSVDRAVAILYLLAQRGVAGVTEVAAELDVHKSTAFRLIGALESGGLIDQDGERGKYRLGLGILRLAAATAGQLELPTESRSICRRLAAELDEAVNIAILDDTEAMNILQEYGTSSITGRNWIGQRTALHATATGKVLLAYADAVTRKRVLGGQLHRFTGHTVTRVAVLEAELATVRRQGWAETSEELEIGLNGVAAPIHDATGKVIAAVGASGPSHRLSPDSFPAVAARLVVGAREIGARLGYFERPSHRE
jgi:DNA-binding IclR family transcriptional regulator